jgi:serine/threonine protein kinase
MAMMNPGPLNGELLDGKYQIESLLGEGGMGAVYRAVHLGTKRTVAVKVIHPQFSGNEEFVARFRREAEAAGRLRHPNVVDVTDFGFARTAAGRVAYLVMEYLDGCTLGEVLDEEQRLPTTWVVDILEQICSAVDEAHRLGLIHRDLKPDNIWLEPNRRGGYTVKVLDFGLAKLGDQMQASPAPVRAPAAARTASETATLIKPPAALEEEAATLIQQPMAGPDERPDKGMDGDGQADQYGLTLAGSTLGTPLYMSPEQCRGERLDARSDIYSIGVMAYRMLAGETPFTGSIPDLLRLHTTSEPPPLRVKNPKVPEKIARLVMASLAKDPAMRPPSAAGFGAALAAGAEGSGFLLRRAAALYSEHFPTFLKISLLAYAPLAVVVIFFRFSDRIISPSRLAALSPVLLGPLLFIAIIVTNLLAYAVVSAVTIPLVVQLITAPLRMLRVRTALFALRRRWAVFSAASIAVLAGTLAGALLLVLPGIVMAISHALYAPVAVMESLGVRATLARARALMKRSWTTVLIITALQFALPILVWIATVDATFVFRIDENWNPKELTFSLGTSGNSVLYQMLNIFVTPLTAIMTALLYLKARQAGGESVKDAVEQFDALEIPRSRWQARMRSRSSVGSGRES